MKQFICQPLITYKTISLSRYNNFPRKALTRRRRRRSTIVGHMGVRFPTPIDVEGRNNEIRGRLPINSFVWRNDLKKRIAIIDGYIASYDSNGIFVNVGVTNIMVVIADEKMYDHVGENVGRGSWPIDQVVLASKSEISKLKKQ